jgi:hypothetical protein
VLLWKMGISLRLKAFSRLRLINSKSIHSW